MAFKRIQLMDIWNFLRRWHDGQSISSIAGAVGCDRKTVRNYITLARREGLTRETVLERKEEVLPRLYAGGTQSVAYIELIEHMELASRRIL